MRKYLLPQKNTYKANLHAHSLGSDGEMPPEVMRDEYKKRGYSVLSITEHERLVDYTGDSFRDLTRIARINDQMWSELFIANKEALLNQMDMFTDKFNQLRTMLETEDVDGMREMMRLSTARRALFDKKGDTK